MTLALPTSPGDTIGELLRSWRQRRNLSQFQLAMSAEVSSRHVSFVETGRARPSREMVLHLAEHLDIPLRERNALLLAAGYAPIYPERQLQTADMAPVRDAIERFLRAHEPYPAIVLDRHFTALSANDAGHLLTDGVAEELLAEAPNALRITLHPNGMAPRIANFEQWSGHLMHRLRRQASITADPTLEELYTELKQYPGVSPGLTEPAPDLEILLPLRLHTPAGQLTLFSSVSTFGSAADITLAELTIEAFYPADATTANHLLTAINIQPH